MADDWPDDRQEIVYLESRAVIDAQNETMSDIDEKAMRTVRLNTIILGIALTGFQLAPKTFREIGLRVAFGFLVVSTILGMITYNESNLYVGPRGDFIEDLAISTAGVCTWHEDVLVTMAGMIAENYDTIRRNEHWLTATQATLCLGIIAAVAAVAI